MGRTAISRLQHRAQAIVLGPHDHGPLRRLTRAIVAVKALGADPIGGVAAIAEQPDRLTDLVQSRGDGTGQRNRQIAANRFVMRRIGVPVEVEHEGRSGHRRRLVDLAVQRSGAGGRRPVDAPQRVAELPLANPTDPRRILNHRVANPNLADRSRRGDVVTRQRHLTRIDQQVLRRSADAIAPAQPHQIAGFEHRGADLEIAAALAHQSVLQPAGLAAAKEEHGEP